MNVVPMFFPMSILTPKAEEALGMELVPSYCYARIYMKGSEMMRHVDRDSSVYACTINLNSSHSGWPIYLEDKNGKDIVNTVKKREFFRPFGATVMLEHAHDWFEMLHIKELPIMTTE